MTDQKTDARACEVCERPILSPEELAQIISAGRFSDHSYRQIAVPQGRGACSLQCLDVKEQREKLLENSSVRVVPRHLVCADVSLRDQVAMHALGFIYRESPNGERMRDMAEEALALADAFMEARAKWPR